MEEKEQKQDEALEQALSEIREYERRRASLVRPHISVWRAVLNIIIPLCVASGIFSALYFTLPKHALGIALGASLGVLGLYIVLRLRDIAIWFVRVYQATAPDEVRLRCVFTPSCSEYTIAALSKYGFWRALPKIFSRFRRCHPPNGGDDPLEQKEQKD